MTPKQAAQIRRGILRAKANADCQVVASPIQSRLERKADARTWARYMQQRDVRA